MTPLPVLSCDGCGACCARIGTPPGYAIFFPLSGSTPSWAWESPDGVRFGAMSEEVRASLAGYYAAVTAGLLPDRTADDDTPCLWYDPESRRCIHHEWRPDVCREFEVGTSDCLRMRKEAGL